MINYQQSNKNCSIIQLITGFPYTEAKTKRMREQLLDSVNIH